MSRLACLRLSQLALQIVLREHPDWLDQPVAIVLDERPSSALLFCNDHALKRGLHPGLRYGAALALLPSLHARAVSALTLKEEHRALLDLLYRFSPTVEASASQRGTFWLDRSGLSAPPKRWAAAIHEVLKTRALIGTLRLGFSRFNSYICAQGSTQTVLFEHPKSERRAALQAPLSALALPHRAQRDLEQLGVLHVGDFLALPQSALHHRFGRETVQWHQMGHAQIERPLRPFRVKSSVLITLDFDDAIQQTERLFALLEHRLNNHPRFHCPPGESLSALTLCLQHERSYNQRPPDHLICVRPSVAATQPKRLLDLLHRRLNSLSLKGRVHRAIIQLSSRRDAVEQGQLVGLGGERDAQAATRVLDQLRAELGEHAVYTLKVKQHALPERQALTLPLTSLRRAQPGAPVRAQAIRRVYHSPRPVQRPARWCPTFHLSGGWWDHAFSRDYGSNPNKEWLFKDANTQQFFVQGQLE